VVFYSSQTSTRNRVQKTDLSKSRVLVLNDPLYLVLLIANYIPLFVPRVIMVDTRCGWGSLKENTCLQKFANLKVYALILGLINFFISASYSYQYAVQSTTQSVYSLSATDVGTIYALFEVGSITSNILASYFFTKKHIPRVSWNLWYKIQQVFGILRPI